MKDKLHLAMSTKNFDGISLIKRLRKIASFGVRFIVLNLDKDTSLEEAESAYKDFSQLGLKCVQVVSDNMPKSYISERNYSQAIEEINKTSEIQEIYGGKQIEVTAGSFRGKKEEHFDAAVKFIKEACDIAASKGQYAALDFTPKRNQLIKTWSEMKALYAKVEKDNLLLNINTAALHHLSVDEDDMLFLESKASLIELLDIEDDNWSTEINLGEGISDIKNWIQKTKPFLFESCKTTGTMPVAVLILQNSEKAEIQRTLKYFESIMPDLRL